MQTSPHDKWLLCLGDSVFFQFRSSDVVWFLFAMWKTDEVVPLFLRVKHIVIIGCVVCRTEWISHLESLGYDIHLLSSCQKEDI